MMKIQKLLLAAVFAGSVFVGSGCGLFDSGAEDDISEFYVPDSDPTGGNAKRGLVPVANLRSAETGKVPDFGNSENLLEGGDYADGFGARIPNVSFEPIYFFFDQNNIPRSEESKVQAVIDYLKGNPKAGVVIEGNCDERGTEQYNRSLGQRRALAAQDMILNAGIDAMRVKSISNGEEKPAVTGTGEAVWSKNRRDEFIPVFLKN